MSSRVQRVFAGLALSLVSLACADLPIVDAGVCGNGIVEGTEDCDTYAPPGQVCRPPTADKGACRFDCTAKNGVAPACPSDARCGTDGICRFSTGTFAPWGEPLAMPAQTLKMGDFDGDGRQDLLALGNSNDLWQSFPRILFFDGTGQPQNVFDPRIPVSSPSILTLNQSDTPLDPRQQLVSGSSYGISALEVTSERAVLPIPYPIQQLPQGWLYRMVRLRGTSETSVNEAVLIFMSLSGSNTTEIGQIIVADTGFQLGPMPNPVDQIVGVPIGANFIDGSNGTDSPCEEALVAFGGDSHVYMLAPCDSKGQWVHSTQPPSAVVSLTSLSGNPAIGQTPIAARVDKDAHIDLLLADEAGNPYLAFGIGDGTFVADPNNPDSTLKQAWPVSVTQGNCPGPTASDTDGGGPQPDYTEFPLAVGDLNGDGLSDWVMPHGVALIQSVNVDSSNKQVVIRACVTNQPFAGTWSAARIADLNRDSLLDVIVGSSSETDLTFLEGTGLDVLNTFPISSGGKLSHLAIGDFDGDLISDIAFSVQTNSGTQTSSPMTEKLSIAFGSISGSPESPIEIGQFATIEQMEAAKYSGNDAIDEIGVFALSGDNSGQQLSVFIGTTGRHPIAPLGLANVGQDGSLVTGLPLATAIGKIGGNTNPGGVSIAGDCESNNCTYRLWLVPGAAHGKFDAPIPSPLLPAEFIPYWPDTGKVSAYVLLGDVDSDKLGDAFALTSSAEDTTADTTIKLWRINLPPPQSAWTDPPVQLLGTTSGRLTVASNPMLIDLDGDGAPDLVMIAEVMVNGNREEQLGVVWNSGKSLDLSQLRGIELGGQLARGFSVANDRDTVRLVAITSDATYAITNDGTYKISPGKGRVLSAIPMAMQPNGIPGGDTITLGDMTGDGLLDLAIGVSVPGQVQLFQETPERQ
jgi:hypothetical protein